MSMPTSPIVTADRLHANSGKTSCRESEWQSEKAKDWRLDFVIYNGVASVGSDVRRQGTMAGTGIEKSWQKC
jgi:hypothetical protein